MVNLRWPGKLAMVKPGLGSIVTTDSSKRKTDRFWVRSGNNDTLEWFQLELKPMKFARVVGIFDDPSSNRGDELEGFERHFQGKRIIYLNIIRSRTPGKFARIGIINYGSHLPLRRFRFISAADRLLASPPASPNKNSAWTIEFIEFAHAKRDAENLKQNVLIY